MITHKHINKIIIAVTALAVVLCLLVMLNADALTQKIGITSYALEYEKAADMLYETVTLRAASIAGQLDGTITSTDEGQREDSSALVDASHIDVSAMGQFSMGGFGGDGDSGPGFRMRGRNGRVRPDTTTEQNNEYNH